jgi:hypothetical protein
MSDTRSPIERLYAIIERDGLASLTEAEAGLLGIWFVAETNNGGVHQFFFNDSGQFAVPALRYLEQIGAAKTASILRRAIALFPGGKVPKDQEERREVLETMDDQGISFAPLTNELFSCGEDVNEFHVAYARAHPDLFSRVRGGGAAS